MQDIMNVVLQSLGAIAVGALIALLDYVRKWVKVKFGESGVRTVEILAKNAVESVEQIALTTGSTGEEKKALAIKWIKDIASSQGLKISDDLIDGFLESAVKTMNGNLSKLNSTNVELEPTNYGK